MTSFVYRHILLLALLAFSGMSVSAHAQAPAAPSGCFAIAVSATATNATIGINWNDNSTNETNWKVQYSVSNGPYSDLGNVTSSSTATTGSTGITWSGASLNTVYRFKILSGNGTTFSASSNVATVGTFALNGPINLSVTAVDPFNVIMSWEEGSTGEAGFAIERKFGSEPWQYIGALGANSLALSASQLIEPSGTFSFRIRAYKGSPPTTPDSPEGPNVSPYSNISAINSGAFTLSADTVSGQTLVNLSWPNILGETGYRIFFKADTDSSYSELRLVNANVTTAAVTAPNIEPTKTYSFIVQPVFASGGVGESNIATVTVDGINSKSGTSGTPGSPLAHTFTQISGKSSPVVSRALTGVPTGLTFDSSTGVLTGVYPPLGNYTLNYSATFANGGVLTQAFSIRVRPAAGAPAVGLLIPEWQARAGATRDTPLAGTFTDAEAESAVRVSTTLGNMDFILFNTATPATVTNFMSYVNSGKYSDVVFHRSITDFVIQGGGFKGAGTGSNFNSVVTNPTVVNEPGIANVYGTISMAKLGGDPNSATSQFFVSLGDNRWNLDFQNGGFTVFGRVAGNGMTVAESISDLPNDTYNLLLNGSTTHTPFANFPLNVPSLPAPMDQTKLVKINSVTSIPTLNYSVTGNTSPTVASASIVGGQLRLVALASGQTNVTVTATDLDNLTTSQTVAVRINPALDTFASWAASNSFPNGQSATGQNPDLDEWNNLQEYAFFGTPGVRNAEVQTIFLGKTGTNPKHLTMTFPVRKFTQGLSYALEANNELSGTWTEIWKSSDGFSHAQVVSQQDQADRTVITVKDTAPISGETRFLRVRVIQN